MKMLSGNAIFLHRGGGIEKLTCARHRRTYVIATSFTILYLREGREASRHVFQVGAQVRPHECVFKSLRFHHFTENAMRELRPHDRFHIVLPVHTETIKTTENAFNLLRRKCRRRYLNLGA